MNHPKVDEAKDRMHKAVVHLQEEFGSIRTGRAVPALVEKLKVDAYGSEAELRTLAGITVPEARVLAIAPYDKGNLKSIEKAIQASDLGVNPSNDGTIVRLTFPELTQERRKDLVKVVKGRAEEGRVAVRNVRRDAIKHLEELVKNGDVGDDEEHAAEGRVQKLTDEHTAKIDELLKRKEAEIMEV